MHCTAGFNDDRGASSSGGANSGNNSRPSSRLSSSGTAQTKPAVKAVTSNSSSSSRPTQGTSQKPPLSLDDGEISPMSLSDDVSVAAVKRLRNFTPTAQVHLHGTHSSSWQAAPAT